MAGAGGTSRLQAVDVYRALALVAMAAYHTTWDLNYYGLIEVGIGIDPLWITLQRSILTAFLLLAGASLTLAHGNGIRWRGFWKREAILVAAAAAVSIGTWFLFQGAFAWFGVLHMIAVGSLLCLPTGMHAWEARSAAEITLANLQPVFDAADQIDVLLIGLGSDIAGFDKAIRQALRDRKIIVEAVATGGAVRTYNILLGENRAVAAALIAVETVR